MKKILDSLHGHGSKLPVSSFQSKPPPISASVYICIICGFIPLLLALRSTNQKDPTLLRGSLWPAPLSLRSLRLCGSAFKNKPGISPKGFGCGSAALCLCGQSPAGLAPGADFTTFPFAACFRAEQAGLLILMSGRTFYPESSDGEIRRRGAVLVVGSCA
jgi:hypothetical protein